MEIQGKVIKILELQSGESARGTWKKQEFILETQEQYPKKVCITLWGDKIDQSNLSEGEMVTASINIESREFNERWYTDVRAWRIQKGNVAASAAPTNAPVAGNTPPPPSANDMPAESEDIDDDLPF